MRDLLSVLNYDKLEIEDVNLSINNLKYLSKMLKENKITDNQIQNKNHYRIIMMTNTHHQITSLGML